MKVPSSTPLKRFDSEAHDPGKSHHVLENLAFGLQPGREAASPENPTVPTGSHQPPARAASLPLARVMMTSALPAVSHTTCRVHAARTASKTTCS